ncbi:MAG: hypothetical protein ACTHZ1_04145 [Sphingobacterium sp.]
MVSLNQSSLNKLELLFKELGYRVRYEKGSFRTGACVLQNANVIVVNKFSTIDMKVQSLLQILQGIEVEEELIPEKLKAFFQLTRQIRIIV